MNRATPEQMRAAIKGAQVLTNAGVPWIPVPFASEKQQQELAQHGAVTLENMAMESELLEKVESLKEEQDG